jgi:hypothetical protein
MSIVLLAPTAQGDFAPTDTVSLREIEQEVARRVGPFALRYVKNPSPGDQTSTNSTTTVIALPSVRSSLDLGGMEDMYVLRRGRLRDGTLLPTTIDGVPVNFTEDDRLRLVRTYRPQDGVLEVDSPYLYPTHDAEEVELHHLDPDQELRPAVLAGLRRCYVVHRLGVAGAVPGAFQPIDLTAQAPWLQTRDQVFSVAMSGGAPQTGWRVESYGGGLMLTLTEYSFGRSYVVNRRPATSMVLPEAYLNGNGEVEPEGWVVRAGNANEPWADEDRFPVPMDYAAAAGHIECWRTARPRLSLASQTGMWADQKEAAAEFTRVSTVHYDPPRHDTPLSMTTRMWLDNPLSNSP